SSPSSAVSTWITARSCRPVTRRSAAGATTTSTPTSTTSTSSCAGRPRPTCSTTSCSAGTRRASASVPTAPGRTPSGPAARRDPRAAALFAQLATLGRHPRFTLAGLAASLGGGRYQDVYVHAKAALVDDAWATIGSTNVASRSFYADTELNASLWDPGTARGLRCAPFRQ